MSADDSTALLTITSLPVSDIGRQSAEASSVLQILSTANTDTSVVKQTPQLRESFSPGRVSRSPNVIAGQTGQFGRIFG
ncbi:jg5755 [Pararge aegeria aegeria]|uniref:Jg5755 protein n=1 Tax=Pararge aegeria aegeria TaxID=348720 RepID=A0A8S4SGN7_9NEOP|nr:jg5755 [Pararge aegeria aegeria]